MAIEQITIITCDVCGVKMDKRCGVSLETGEPRSVVQQDIPAHEIDLCHKHACEALQKALDDLMGRLVDDEYGYIMDVIFSDVKRID